MRPRAKRSTSSSTSAEPHRRAGFATRRSRAPRGREETENDAARNEGQAAEPETPLTTRPAFEFAKFLGSLGALGLAVAIGATVGVVGLSLLILAFGWLTTGLG